jgi:hypothetical protein
VAHAVLRLLALVDLLRSTSPPARGEFVVVLPPRIGCPGSGVDVGTDLCRGFEG